MSIAAFDGFVWRRGKEGTLIVEASIDISRYRASVRASVGLCAACGPNARASRLMSFDVSDGFVWRRGNERALIVEPSIDISRLARAYGHC